MVSEQQTSLVFKSCICVHYSDDALNSGQICMVLKYNLYDMNSRLVKVAFQKYIGIWLMDTWIPGIY